MTGNLTCLLMLKTTIFPGVLLEENIPKQNSHQAVHLHAFVRVDAHFGGNIVGSFPLVRMHHRDCLYNHISPLGTSLLIQTKSKWIFLFQIYCIDWVLSHKSFRCHPWLASWSIDCTTFVIKAWRVFFIKKSILSSKASFIGFYLNFFCKTIYLHQTSSTEQSTLHWIMYPTMQRMNRK